MDQIYARPPPPAELVQAWKSFFGYKNSKKEALNNIQAQHAILTFKHLEKDNAEEGFGLENADLKLALLVTTWMPKDSREAHNELARILYSELSRREGPGFDRVSSPLLNFVSVLADTGDTSAGRDIAVRYSAVPHEELDSEQRKGFGTTKRRLWNLVMAGYAREDNEVELLKTADMAEAAGCYYGFATQETMTTFYASKNDIPNAKQWFNNTLHGPRSFPTARTMSSVLEFSIRNGELDWCKAVFREILDKNPPKPVWDVLFQWAARGLGKGVEDVERMIEVMIRCNPANEDGRPDVETMNGLVELAI